jgi:hypothetical protein
LPKPKDCNIWSVGWTAAVAPIARSPRRGQMPIVDQSLREKGRNGAGHAAKIARHLKKSPFEALTIFRIMTYGKNKTCKPKGPGRSRGLN